jgi:hypothetical protein
MEEYYDKYKQQLGQSENEDQNTHMEPSSEINHIHQHIYGPRIASRNSMTSNISELGMYYRTAMNLTTVPKDILG